MRAKRGFKTSRLLSLFLVVMFIIPAENALATGAAGESEILIAEESASSLDVADHIVINEVCENTSSGAQWIELYNPTDHEFIINPRPLSSNSTDYWIIRFNEESAPHILLPEFTISPDEYVVLAPYNNTREYWQIPENVKVIENLNFHHMWGTRWHSVRIGNKSSYDIFGESIGKSVVPQISFNHSWARYRGGYDTDNFTNDFYDEPHPTPGYENHRAKDDSSLSSPGWPESSLMLAMSVTVLVSAGILVAIFGKIRRNA